MMAGKHLMPQARHQRIDDFIQILGHEVTTHLNKPVQEPQLWSGRKPAQPLETHMVLLRFLETMHETSEITKNLRDR